METVSIDVRSDENILAIPYIAKLAKFLPKLRRVEIARRRAHRDTVVTMMGSTLFMSIDTMFPGVKGKHNRYNDYTEADHVVWEREGGDVLKTLEQERRERDGRGEDGVKKT
jgi:polyphosphate kinase